MNITILGTGSMAKAIAGLMVTGGNNVTLVSRDPGKADAAVKALAGRAKKGATVKVVASGSPLVDPVVINTLYYPASLDAVKQYGAQVNGKILVDISNPVNSTFDDLATPPGTSAAEELAKVAPQAHVVKAFNTTFAGLLNQGHVATHKIDVFIAGDDENAKAALARLIEEGGQHPVDAGPLKRARQLEGLAFLMITLQSKMEKPWMTGVKILS